MGGKVFDMVHEAISRALDEAGIKNEVLRGMCLEVGIEKFQDLMDSRQSNDPGLFCPECDAPGLLFECGACGNTNHQK